ncbi:MAG: 2-oxoacid:acceptor oxidoreductase subunit alpha [Oscillospiraceae bacterium]|nr:2-oxoacid:acceptor oxidoreductase subunit alpha [Oscillospiraceae bacterium]
MSGKRVLMQGNEACVEGALAAGMRFYAGYPITPSTEIAELAATRLPMLEGHFIQMEDEIGSMAAVIGASVAGVKAMTATSGPGFSLKQENIGYAATAEVPCVIVNVQRVGPSTGMPTSTSQGDIMQARWGTHGDHPVITIAPSSVGEVYDEIIRAFNLSEKYRVPVIFLMDETVGHMREGIEIPDADSFEVVDRALPDPDDENWLPFAVESDKDVPKIPPFGMGRRYHITGLTHDERGYPTSDPVKAEQFINRLMNKIELNRGDIDSFEEYKLDDAEVAVLCIGSIGRSAREAVNRARAKGIKAGLFRPITVWPFPEKEVAALARRIKKLVVAEQNCGQIVLEADRCVHGACPVQFVGKANGSMLMPDEILAALEGGEC